MDVNEIVSFLSEAGNIDIDGPQDLFFCHTVLQSLSAETLAEVETRLKERESPPWELLSFIDWLWNHPSSNDSVSTLLRWYKNKKGKKVEYAFKQLSRICDFQSYNVRKQIIRAFLLGGKHSSERAAVLLRKQWVSGLEKEIKMAWQSYRGKSLARTIIQRMPEKYVLQEQDALVSAASNLMDPYATICGRLINTPGFMVDETKLRSIPGWFYVMAKYDRQDRISVFDEKVNLFIRSQKCENFIHVLEDKPEFNPISYLEGMDWIIKAMKKLHFTEGLIRLAKLNRSAMNLVKESGFLEFRVALSIYFLQSLVEDDLPNEIDYRQMVQSWQEL